MLHLHLVDRCRENEVGNNENGAAKMVLIK
jgi:hypothetical protein